MSTDDISCVLYGIRDPDLGHHMPRPTHVPSLNHHHACTGLQGRMRRLLAPAVSVTAPYTNVEVAGPGPAVSVVAPYTNVVVSGPAGGPATGVSVKAPFTTVTVSGPAGAPAALNVTAPFTNVVIGGRRLLKAAAGF